MPSKSCPDCRGKAPEQVWRCGTCYGKGKVPMTDAEYEQSMTGSIDVKRVKFSKETRAAVDAVFDAVNTAWYGVFKGAASPKSEIAEREKAVLALEAMASEIYTKGFMAGRQSVMN